MDFRFLRFFEFSAFLPIFAICLACLYKYTFYNSLDLSWILSQLSISGILLNAVPIFIEMFLGFSMAAALYIYLRAVFDEGISYKSLFILFIIFITTMKISNWDTPILTILMDRSIFFYTYTLVATIFFALENTNFIRSICVGICLFSLIFLQSFIDYKSGKEIEKLFKKDDSFSRVYFTDEGNKRIPTTYTSIDENGKKQSYLLDWRLLELIGDKAIIIVSNDIKLDGIDKPQVRIIEYKLIDRVY